MDMQKTILVIEDDLGQRQIYDITLKRAGFNVVAKGDAYEGLRWLEQILPDLILLDVMLPGISGIDMLAEIRETENGKDVPVVIATAHWEVSTDTFERYQISAFLRKPLSPNELVDTVRNVLESAGQ